MTGIDQPPTRLERAKQKLRDLLERRQGARTAVVAYAGSAHAVLPLTDDTALVELYLESLEPAIMPIAGDKPDLALGLAMDMLATEEAPGTVIFMTDGIDRTLADTFAEAGAGVQVLLLGFGTEAGGPEDGGSGVAPGIDLGGLAAVAEAAGGEFIRSSLDSRDIDHLEGRVHSHLVNTVGDDESVRWQDSGYLLLWPLALVLLVWSRRGWTVQWG